MATALSCLLMLVTLLVRQGARMKDWGPWDWIAYSTLGLSALLLAFDVTLGSLPALAAALPSAFSSKALTMIPVILFFASTMIFIARHTPATTPASEHQRMMGTGLRANPSVKTSAQIKIKVAPSEPYVTREVVGGHYKSTAMIGIRNIGETSLSNFKVFIDDITPPPLHPRPMPMELEGGGFMLRPDDPEKLFEIAVYWDHIDKYRFFTPQEGAFNTLTYISANESRIISIRVAATECIQSGTFFIFMNQAKRLILQDITGHPVGPLPAPVPPPQPEKN